MMLLKQKQNEGISLRTIHISLVIGALIFAGIMFHSTYYMLNKIQYLTENSAQQIKLRKAALEFMTASDFLTESVQRFTITGDIRFLREYFNETFDMKHREEAVNIMSVGKPNGVALARIQSAMFASRSLMRREYYAMMLVIDAKKYTDYPEILNSIKLSDKDRASSPEDKMSRASKIVHDESYFNKKEQIREDIKISLEALEKTAYDNDASEFNSIQNEMLWIRLIIMCQIIGIFLMVALTSRIGIQPILEAVDRIKADRPIPEVGANEFRYLARAYNKMYDIYKSSLDRLNFKASHDELTGAYNRLGYELLLSSINLKSTYMLLFDADNFKGINDNFGHEIGDKILMKIVKALKNNFRSDDYVCRIGGDEFIVLMVHSENKNNLIISRLLDISRELEETDDGLPAASLSVGIAHGSDANDTQDLFKKADEAMYKSKQKGKSTYTFYESEIK